MKTRIINYVAKLYDGTELIIPNVEVSLWDIDGKEEEAFGPEAYRQIEAAIEAFRPGYFRTGKRRTAQI